jgi:hypothetical protein
VAEHAGLTLLVDHTFLYGAPVRKIRELLDRSDLGAPFYFDSVRVNLGLFQSDVNVIGDLAAHDLRSSCISSRGSRGLFTRLERATRPANDLAPDEQLRIYESGVTISSDAKGVYKLLVAYRMGDVWMPHLDRYEPLAANGRPLRRLRTCRSSLREGGPGGVRVDADGRVTR